ncbi:PEFG-CTERM sorting domain-containing protein [Nitrosarchaeum sp.]|uniref:PEFG-CTERM sorting domain-containing protein n=1 Tax=Nitrosarchaeum sp. TaxID=2026886 RepID=UPI00247BC738|nr:PEFG-CTERM sorting domain-containing protein [Nitrosarchaeum sp.]MCV0413220.1 PEFG-CTERM sorting domain-containing protein [Nitrosarchaeum sp.]
MIILIGFVGIAYGDTNCVSICILESSWDGTKYVNPGETYWLKVQIQPSEKLHIKIFYYDDSIVHDKIYTPNDEGIVLVEYTSPKNEDSLSFYRVAMMVENNPLNVAGTIFRIGDTYPTDLIRFSSVPNLQDATSGDTIQLFTESNRWDNPIEPYSKLTLTLINPHGIQVFQKQVTANELGQFTDLFTITEKGFYKLVVEDQKRRNVHIFPLNHDTKKIITAEGKDFEITFGHPTREGIEFSIHNMVFDQQGKSLTAFVENPAEDNVRFDIKIPHEFLDGNMTTIVDGNIRTDIEQKHILGYSSTFFLLPAGNHTVQIIGTSAIPEFESIVLVILAVSILPIVLTRNKSLLK